MSVSEVTAFEDRVSRICHLMVNQRSNSVEEYIANRCNKIQYNGMPIQYNFTRQCNAIQLQCNAAQYNNLYLNSASCENKKYLQISCFLLETFSVPLTRLPKFAWLCDLATDNFCRSFTAD